MALGATRSTYFAEQSAKIMGEELRSLGINTNFAPVLDVNINPDNPVIGVRSYSEDPDLVSQLGIAQIKGYTDAGIMSTAKHFPGHGDTDVDSHYGLPIIVHDLETLLAVDIKPFKAAIDAGVSSIMTAHIVVPALDNSGLPATLSRPILTDFLRGELGFNGLIITDSLDMSGANVLPAEKIPVEAFKAGADILLNPPNVDLAYTAMLNAVQRGEITKKRLNDSIYRILKAKMRQALFDNPYTDSSEIAIIGNKDNLLQAETMTNDSITLIKNDNSALPIEDNTKLLITGPNSEKLMLLSNLLKEKGIKVNSYITDLNPTQEQINTAVNHANNIEKIIVTTYNAKTNIAQQYLINALYNTNKPIIVVALRNPYDIAAFPYIDAYLTTYGDQDISIKALAAVLTGEIRPKGILPVSIPPLYKLGDRLAY
jgi:beta-N-acetylhexosaminidase